MTECSALSDDHSPLVMLRVGALYLMVRVCACVFVCIWEVGQLPCGPTSFIGWLIVPRVSVPRYITAHTQTYKQLQAVCAGGRLSVCRSRPKNRSPCPHEDQYRRPGQLSTHAATSPAACHRPSSALCPAPPLCPSVTRPSGPENHSQDPQPNPRTSVNPLPQNDPVPSANISAARCSRSQVTQCSFPRYPAKY